MRLQRPDLSAFNWEGLHAPDHQGRRVEAQGNLVLKQERCSEDSVVVQQVNDVEIPLGTDALVFEPCAASKINLRA